MRSLYLTLNTVKYLKLRQIFYRLYYRFKPLKIIHDAQLEVSRFSVDWNSPAYLNASSEDGESHTFLGVTSRIDKSWNAPNNLPKLWLYNLHYHDNLNAKGSEDRHDLCAEMIDGWIYNNPPLSGTGWEPYCISLRIVNWVKWLSRGNKHEVKEQWVQSLYEQAFILEQRLEYNILANHLFANAKALIFAGAFLSGPSADRWLSKGLELLDEEIEEQFLDDGAHYELSPMYHSIMLWDLADLVNLASISLVPELLRRLEKIEAVFLEGVSWLRAMVHPDGDISFFNDAALGIGPTLQDVLDYSKHLGLNSRDFGPPNYELVARFKSESGYCCIDWDAMNRLILDVAKIGPDYQPGHAHADTLSCELSLAGRRVLVNSGISRYEECDRRTHERSTRSHNTVEVDGQDSSEVWAGFRVARRAYPINVAYTANNEGIYIEASHTGYRRLPGKVTHKRKWEASQQNLTITDYVIGAFKSAKGFWHFHPDVEVILDSEAVATLNLPTGFVMRLELTGANVAIIDDTWQPEFGKMIKSKCLVYDFTDTTVVTRMKWGLS